MKTKTMAILLTAGFVVSGCWDNEKERRASQFMGGLTRCDDCKLDKPLIGGKKEEAR
jgi:hypothetical protein